MHWIIPFDLKPSILFLLINDSYYFSSYDLWPSSKAEWNEYSSNLSILPQETSFAKQIALHTHMQGFVYYILLFKQVQFFNNIHQLSGANMEATLLDSFSTTLATDNWKNRCNSFVII